MVEFLGKAFKSFTLQDGGLLRLNLLINSLRRFIFFVAFFVGKIPFELIKLLAGAFLLLLGSLPK